MQPPEDRDEMYAKLKRNRERILLVLYRFGDLRSREIRDRTDLSKGSKNHHYEVLQDWGLIEVVGKNGDSGGWAERIFGLTAEGETFVEDYLADTDDEQPDSYVLRVERLEDEVDELRTENERLEETIEQQHREIETLEEELRDETEEIREKLEGEYWRAIVDEIEART